MCLTSLRQGGARPSLPTRGQPVSETSRGEGGSGAHHQVGWGKAKRTADVLLHPSEGDSSFFAAFTESQQEGAWGLGAQDGPLPLLTDKAHYVPGGKEEKHQDLG